MDAGVVPRLGGKALKRQVMVWKRLRRCDFAPLVLPLARQQGWSEDDARRVLEEYRRFCLLAVNAEEELTPSRCVDAAWHLHVEDAAGYARFCDEVLQAPLEHRPAPEGSGSRMRRQYRATLHFYKRLFGPPSPRFWPEEGPPEPAPIEPCRSSMASVPWWRLRVWGPLTIGLWLLATWLEGSINPLEWGNTLFLLLQPGLLVLALLASGRGRRWLRDRRVLPPTPALSATELAMLAGGGERLGLVLTLKLLQHDAIGLQAPLDAHGVPQQDSWATLHKREGSALPPELARTHARIAPFIPLRQLVEDCRRVEGPAMSARLELMGLEPGGRRVLEWALCMLPFALLFCLQLARYLQGIEHDAPVGLLTVVMGATGIVLFVRLLVSPGRLGRAHADLLNRISRELHTLPDPADALARRVALQGAEALRGSLHIGLARVWQKSVVWPVATAAQGVDTSRDRDHSFDSDSDNYDSDSGNDSGGDSDSGGGSDCGGGGCGGGGD